jgi:hypothetical protein
VSAPPLPGRDVRERRHDGGELEPTSNGDGRGVRSDIAARAGELTVEPGAGDSELAMLDVDHTCFRNELVVGGPTGVPDALMPAVASGVAKCSEIVGGALTNGGGEVGCRKYSAPGAWAAANANAPSTPFATSGDGCVELL